ncbi:MULTISPECIES: VOC family protein [Rhizobium]|uniref:VOC family protein n=1 Tax=Rhizobium rhododendri TaxID=2506430 RepID=A0ABY8ILA7_9HYPH|nr:MULTISPECIES: VOC family protein [Rhizobium]MBZ5761489.1 VOC family protein [Rhizobium sp. VS19-DR96]MBZ5767437.1 VOC family protein [Rhizobium sp. VS19-DR129.2]MBZ5775114.1 VOC family protein [Rhizobium sp. VS19-DRK62.2]MBZ5785921.1 VOC family protein [Rhizobium sp. VS19-DR121]MBZ5803347.1 VOC family protein [Rhizobium sp. VS19-DR181]
MTAAYPIDHLVLPTCDIASARQRLSKVGFTVAADARHPFGTENACVFFADKTYLEPLGIASLSECEASALAGNVFVARDQAFRFRVGDDGFSSIAFATGNAESDQQRFLDSGVSGGKILEFERPLRMPDGSESIAGFRLAFAADLRAPDFFVFTCERINAMPTDRSALERHPNGVLGISRIVLSSASPEAFSGLISEVGNGAAIAPHSFGITASSANVEIDILSGEGMEAFYEVAPSGEDPGLRGRAIVFAVRDLSVTEAHLAGNGVTYTRKSNTILVKAAPGQGALFAFEETA